MLERNCQAIYLARLIRISKVVTYWDNSFSEIHGKLKKMKKALTHVPRFPTSTAKPKSYGDKTQMFLCLPSLPRDRWRSCRLNSSNSIGSECSIEFVVFSQPMVRVTVIHDWVTTLPVSHVLNHKMDLQWKPRQTSIKNFHTCTIWSSHRNFYSSA